MPKNMNLKTLPRYGMPFRCTADKKVWTVVQSTPSCDAITLEDGDGASWAISLEYLNKHFEAFVTPLMYHEVMDRSAMMVDVFERWVCDPIAVQVHPQLKAKAEAVVAHLQSFYECAAEEVFKDDD